MNHQDEIFVCSHCKTANYDNEKKCIECSDLPSISSRTPYLPSSSVKELVEAAQVSLNFIQSHDFASTGDIQQLLIDALQPFKEEK